MAKETPFDRARDFVEEKIEQTKEVLGDSLDGVGDEVRVPVGRRSQVRQGQPRHGARDFGRNRVPVRLLAARRRRRLIRISSLEKALPDDVRRTVRDHPLLAIVGGALAGFYIGRSHGREILTALVGVGISAGAANARRLLGVEARRAR